MPQPSWLKCRKIPVTTLEYRINGGGVKIIGGLEMARYNNDRGVGTIGGGCLEKLKIVVFFAKHIPFIYLCEK